MFTVVVPVFKNQESLPDLLDTLEAMDTRMGGELEVVLVVDGSPDRCAEILEASLGDRSFDSQLLILSRNFGAFAAIRAGIAHARGEALAVMAADLQEPPELVHEFKSILESGDFDVVVGRRESRSDPVLQRLTSNIFWWLYRKLVQPEVPKGGVDIFGCTRSFAQRLVGLNERNSSLIGLLFWLGSRRSEVGYQRQPRRHGGSAWTAARKVRYLLDSTFAFTDLPVRLLSSGGLIGMALAIVLGVVVLLAKIIGEIDVPGYTATLLVVLFFGALHSFGLGLLGEYVWRAFENTKARPHYIVDNWISFDRKG